MLITNEWLDDQGLEGVDADIETSLIEYGFAYKPVEEEVFFANEQGERFDVDYEFIYGIGYGEDGNYNKFDKAHMTTKEFVELIEEDWFDLNDVLEFTGMKKNDFINLFPLSVYDCISYYGYQSIFGDSYGGFELEFK